MQRLSRRKNERWIMWDFPIKDLVAWNPKMYSFITEDSHETWIKKAKSINKHVFDNQLKHEDYKNLLFNRSYIRHEMNRIQSKYYDLGSYRINKIYLYSYNYKKCILKDGSSRLSHFHKSTH